MKRASIFLALLLFLTTCFGNAAANPTADGSIPDNTKPGYVDEIKLGPITVLTIVDNAGTATPERIRNLAEHPEYAALVPQKTFPSVFKTCLVQFGKKKILVDSGTGSTMGQPGKTLAVLAERGVKPKDITDIILTHMDYDHVGGLMENGKAVFPKAALHICQAEYDAWLSGTVGRPADKVALVQQLVAPYKKRTKLFAYGKELFPHIVALDAHGHTPGHVVFDIAAGNEKLTIAGDLLHVDQVQLRYPAANCVFDIDPDQAAAARETTLARLSRENRIIIGMHFPQVGRVCALPDGGYTIKEQ